MRIDIVVLPLDKLRTRLYYTILPKISSHMTGTISINDQYPLSYIKNYLCYETLEEQIITSAIPIQKNSWNHIVFIWGAEGRKIYVNGSIGAKKDNTDHSTSSRSLVIGKSAHYDLDEKHPILDGILDELRIYNRVLSESEVQELYRESEICEDRYDEGFESGKQYCIDHPEECGIDTGGEYTQADIDAEYQNGYNAGVASVGVPECVQDYTQGDLDDKYDEGYNAGVASVDVPECAQDYTQDDLNEKYEEGYSDGLQEKECPDCEECPELLQTSCVNVDPETLRLDITCANYLDTCFKFSLDYSPNGWNIAPGTLETCTDDKDGDGYNSEEDCDDSNPNVNPGATEIPGNGIN
ncbi:MAG: LamG-like jellyroll fold domain-containing protein [Bacillota bacterium]|nr:LamG-like jellyroll fold domain-containing protein [Bacillota bacterium]